MTQVDSPEVDFTQEIRFAVVMYGGISLAIYMNGVAQELLKLVRATAPSPPVVGEQQHALRSENELESTERVYRKLGQMCVRANETRDPATVRPSDKIQTRFVIDILSGSSAGGINAVYLAKALANDQSLRELKDLWVKEGDIGVLVNDSRSQRGTRLRGQNPPRSLLNSRRMYWKLLDALEDMDREPRKAGGSLSPNMEELDLYVTATDIRGQVVKLQLVDGLAREKRHRNVFHFRYSDRKFGQDGDENLRNDFRARYNPFLAYAARCTSAHPAAFEPMKLGDIDEVLRVHPSYQDGRRVRSDNADWQEFYKDYLQAGNVEDFTNRIFNDGGVLDNRPFSYATDAIAQHVARRPVERKLVYIDPAPEDPLPVDPGGDGESSPSIFENAWISLSTLPRHEPIREDLQRVLERNRLVDRLNAITEGVEENIMTLEATASPDATISSVVYTDEEWDQMTLAKMSEEKGLAWGSYQRLRVATVTDDLALLIVRAAGLDESSDEFLAVRALVRHWRNKHYDPDRLDGKLSEHEFLRRFDFFWRLRRLTFVIAKIDEMYSSSERARFSTSLATWRLLGDEQMPAFREELRAIRNELLEVDEKLRGSRKYLWEARREHPLQGVVNALGLDLTDLEDLLKSRKEEDQRRRIGEVFAEKEAEFESFAQEVKEHVGQSFRDASSSGENSLPPDYPDLPVTPERMARQAVRFYYKTFNNYDMVAYPVTYAAGIGEEIAPVEVFRISPKDAPSLIEEKLGEPKLAGTSLNNFGAFFKKEFRTNDVLWGQLDGAERIISALLPKKEDEAKRDALIREAHQIIVAEEVFDKEGGIEDKADPLRGPRKLMASDSETGERGNPSTDLPVHVQDPPLPVQTKTPDLLDYFRDKYKEEYEASRRFDNKSMVHNAARTSRVFGSMLEGYSQTHRQLDNRGVLWLTRLTQLFWALVEVALPNSILNLMFRYWLKLLYFFEALMIVLGVLVSSSTVWRIGVVALIATAALHATVLLLSDIMSGQGRWWRALRYSLIGLVLSTSVLGLILVLAVLGVGEAESWVRGVLQAVEIL